MKGGSVFGCFFVAVEKIKIKKEALFCFRLGVRLRPRRFRKVFNAFDSKFKCFLCLERGLSKYLRVRTKLLFCLFLSFFFSDKTCFCNLVIERERPKMISSEEFKNLATDAALKTKKFLSAN